MRIPLRRDFDHFRVSWLPLALFLAGWTSSLAGPTWPAGFTLYAAENVRSPDGRLGFLVPSGDGYDRGDRCQLVELETGKSLHNIQNGEYWREGEDSGLSHGGVEPLWQPGPGGQGWTCVVHFPGKWQPRNLTLLEIDAAGKTVETDLWAMVGKGAAEKLRGLIPDKAFNENHAFLLTEMTFAMDGPSRVKITALADSNPKDDLPLPRDTATVAATFDLGTRQLSLEVGKVEHRAAVPIEGEEPVVEAPPSTEASAAPPPGGPGSFAEYRKQVNEKTETDAWQSVRVDLPATEKNRTVYLKGWVEAYVLQRLMHVDSLGDDNETVTFYYWREGQLTSIFQVRNGLATGMPGVPECTETYDFVNEKLVAWSRRIGSADFVVNSSDPSFASAAEKLLPQSIELAQPIYNKIGAD